MPRSRTLLFALVAILGGCTSGAGSTPAASSTATTNATAAPVATPVPTTDVPVATEALPTAPPGLTGRLLFSRFEESSHSFTGMFTAAADGSDEAPVPMPWEEGGARWSTSGTEIAIPTMLDDGRIGTAILDPAGAVLRVLEIASPGLNLVCTTWSPDDARIACEGWDDGDASRRGIYTVRSSDGGDIERLTTPPAGMGDDDGDWSKDGKIVFKRYLGDEAPGNLMLVDAGGGKPAILVEGPMEDPGEFSPDGNLIVTSSGGVIQVYDRSGERVERIQEEGQYLFGPVWSPDGAWIVFSRTRPGDFHADLFLSRPDGTDAYQVTRTPTNEIAVDWGP